MKPTPEQIERLDRVRSRVLANPDYLDMGCYHGEEWSPDAEPGDDCGTAHCIAGWLQVDEEDPELRKMLPAQYIDLNFSCIAHVIYTSDEFALEWLRDRRYAW